MIGELEYLVKVGLLKHTPIKDNHHLECVLSGAELIVKDRVFKQASGVEDETGFNPTSNRMGEVRELIRLIVSTRSLGRWQLKWIRYYRYEPAIQIIEDGTLAVGIITGERATYFRCLWDGTAKGDAERLPLINMIEEMFY